MIKDGYIYYRRNGAAYRARIVPNLLHKMEENNIDMRQVRSLNGWLKRELYDYQLEAVFHYMKRGGFILADEMGLGKTLSAIACIGISRCDKAIIVCPAHVKYQWQREIERSVSSLPQVYVCEGRRISKLAAEYLRFAQIVIINYDIMQSWQPHLLRHSYDLMILDEAQRIKKTRSQCTKAVKAVRENTENAICLTGTPITDRHADLWNLVNIVDDTAFPPELRSEYRYMKRFCAPNAHSRLTGVDINSEELHSILSGTGVMLRRRKKEVFSQLPEVEHQVVPIYADTSSLVKMRKQASVLIRKAKAEGRTPDMTGLRACMERYRQEAIKLKMPHLIEWIKDFMESTDQKLMVSVVHREKCGRLLYRKFKDTAVIMDGSLTAKQKEEAKHRFVTDPECRLLIGNILSVGVGTDGLQKVCSNMMYAELDWSPANMRQCTARLDRNGQTEPVSVYYMVVLNSVEEHLARTLDRKSEILSKTIDGESAEMEELLTYMIGEDND